MENTTRDFLVNWTMPHCVLCLRLIGLAFDIADGRHFESLSADQRETALRERPSALETFGYVFFFGGSLVGPQFSFKRYNDFVNGRLIPAQLSNYIPDWYACITMPFVYIYNLRYSAVPRTICMYVCSIYLFIIVAFACTVYECSVLVALGRFCVSIICIIVFGITNMVFSEEYLLSEAFKVRAACAATDHSHTHMSVSFISIAYNHLNFLPLAYCKPK
jgi:hypothetical protein